MPDFPDNLTEIGSIKVSSVLTESGGAQTAFVLSSISAEEAIGRLTVVIDRLRESVAASWGGVADDIDGPVCIEIDCPNCGKTIQIEEDSDD